MRRITTSAVLLLCASMFALSEPLARFPFDPSRKHDRDFRPSGTVKKLIEHLAVYEDTCNVQLKLPDGITCPAPVATVTIAAKSGFAVPFELRSTASGRSIITADITINGRRIGEYAEALIDREH